MELIKQGAEAKLWKDGELLIKDRIKKNYRIDEIDSKLRKTRTRKEAKLLEKSHNLINVPKLHNVDEKSMTLTMEFVHGELVKNVFDELNERVRMNLCADMGKQIAELHNNNIIHGDLTTSNMILNKDKLFLFDFGLGFESLRIEDKAVDLHLLKQAFESKHYLHSEKAFDNVLRGYSAKGDKNVIERLKKVEGRGRYK
ncbi:Kae1-associated serine/threonine protein kinase [Candidatus Woesearchaeota archaeon]|nr:Kae1-associated serine/threonine protein kinase [Candidatus Woesearchaeota archaeon]